MQRAFHNDYRKMDGNFQMVFGGRLVGSVLAVGIGAGVASEVFVVSATSGASGSTGGDGSVDGAGCGVAEVEWRRWCRMPAADCRDMKRELERRIESRSRECVSTRAKRSRTAARSSDSTRAGKMIEKAMTRSPRLDGSLRRGIPCDGTRWM